MLKRVAILANGGDVSGFNAVIRAILKTAENNGVECYGFIDGFRGLLKNDIIKLGTSSTGNAVGILPKGGSIIGSSTNANVFNYPVEENGETVYKDLSDICVENIKKDEIDCLFTLGGDGTQKSARDLSLKGINVIGVPKTIDNDVACTEITFGYNTAVSVATEAIDRLHSTGETHHRIMVLEVMGRYAGWIALESAVAGGADVALIPEIPFTIENIAKHIAKRDEQGLPYTVIAVAEGAKYADGTKVIGKIVEDSPDPVRYSGLAAKVADDLEKVIDCSQKLRHEANQAYTQFYQAAKEKGIEIYTISGYREPETQQLYWDNSVKVFGQEHAIQYNAYPRRSEHELGLCVDISYTMDGDRLSEKVADSPLGKFIESDAYKYGFILRYPQDKVRITGYGYEPWHIRYVGVDLATQLHQENKTLEEYYEG